MKKRRSQPRILGITRKQMAACAHPDLWKMIERDAKKYDCSRSWVLIGLAADHYHYQSADYRKDFGGRLQLVRKRRSA